MLYWLLVLHVLLGACFVVGYATLLGLYRDRAKLASPYFMSLALLTGLLVLVCSFALLHTRAASIGGPLLLFWFFFLWYNKNEYIQNQKHLRKISIHNLIIVEVLIVALVCFNFLIYFNVNNGARTDVYVDEFYYAKTSYQILATGVENNIPNLIFRPDIVTVSPYHYIELWLYGFIYSFFDFNIVDSKIIGALLLNVMIFVLFLLLLIDSKVKRYLSFYVFGGLFISVIAWFGTNGIFGYFTSIGDITFPILFEGKLNLLQLLALFHFFIFNNKLERTFVLYLGVFPFVFISTTPAILMSLVFICFYSFFIDRNNDLFYSALISFGLIIVFVGGFYFVIGETGDSMLQYAQKNKETLIFGVKSLLAYLIQRFLLMIPFVLLFMVIYNDISKQVIRFFVFYIIVLMSGAIAWFLIIEFYDAVQFYNNLEIVVVNLFLLLLWSQCAVFLDGEGREGPSLKSRVVRAFVWLIALSQVVSLVQRLYQSSTRPPRYSEVYLSAVSSLAASLPPRAVGVAIHAHQNSAANGFQFTEIDTLGGYLLYQNPELQPINISTPKDQDTYQTLHPTYRNMIAKTQIFQFSQAFGLQQESVQERQYQFIKARKVAYLILSREVSPDPRLKILESVTDPLSGERFIVLGDL